jgi:H+-translocating NAD(P) transhydrogenase subunit beta
MSEGFVSALYLVAGLLFIQSLSGLSTQTTARRGNVFGVVGMLIALIVTALSPAMHSYSLLIVALAIGGTIGTILAKRVQMTAMPELVAMLHSFVGAAAVLVGIASYLGQKAFPTPEEKVIHEIEIYLGVFVGAITFTGSIIAFGKLRGTLRSKPLLLPARHALNLAVIVACFIMGILFVSSGHGVALTMLLLMTVAACLLGVHLVMAIGGADMPVVVSMLNSYSGWAAAAAGFMLKNDLLIITGALVGSSGAILSYIMCRAMNRSFLSVILGGFGADEGTAPAKSASGEPQGEVTPITAADTASLLNEAKSVVVIPGYGMAVAQAQYALYEIVQHLKNRGVQVRFAIHPVAGRLPGHMNVLLAEAKVPYDIVLEMEEVNEDFPNTDVALVIGANDIVNPGAMDDPSSPIYGMPVLEVWKAASTVVMKRSMASGYAGVENPLFFKENTRMLFGDAKQNVDAILTELRANAPLATA